MPPPAEPERSPTQLNVLTRGPKPPDGEPSLIAEERDPGGDANNNRCRGRKRRRTTNYNRWWKEDDDDDDVEDGKTSAYLSKTADQRSQLYGKKAVEKKPVAAPLSGFAGLKKRTPCPNVVAGKDGIIRSSGTSLHLHPKGILVSKNLSLLPSEKGVIPIGIEGENNRRGSKSAKTDETTDIRDEQRARRGRDNNNNLQRARDSPAASSFCQDQRRPIFHQQQRENGNHSRLLPSEQPAASYHEGRVEVTGVNSRTATTAPVQLVISEDADLDMRVFDVTDLIILSNDSDSGVCLATLNTSESQYSLGLPKKDKDIECTVEVTDSFPSKWKLPVSVDHQPIQDENDRDKLALDLQFALIADQDGDRPLHIAVVHQDVVLVRKLCALLRSVGACVDVYNYLHQTPLHLAVILQDHLICEALLEEGASAHLRDRHGNTAFHLAVKYQTFDCMTVLLRSVIPKEVLNERNYEGLSCLHLAVEHKEVLSALYLVRAGCDINIQDGKSGRTPLMYAVINRDVEVVKCLLKLETDVQATDYAGYTALQFANELENRDISDLLSAKIPTNTF